MTWNKPRPPYWRLVQLLKRLRLEFRERDKGSDNFSIVVPEFGILFRFSRQQFGSTSFKDWDVIEVDLTELEKDDRQFGENLMWLLISKGYLAFLRESGPGNQQTFFNLLIREGWAQKIFDKRLEFYNNEARHQFMIKRTKKFKQISVHYLLKHMPDVFDYLY